MMTSARTTCAGSRNGLVAAPVKLYLQERVRQAETTAAFAWARDVARTARERAAVAQDTHKHRKAQQIQVYVDAYTLPLVPPLNASDMTRDELWRHHLNHLQQWEFEHARLILSVRPRADRLKAQNAVFEKHRAVVHALYGMSSHAELH